MAASLDSAGVEQTRRSMFEALQPYPEDRLQLRLHRARSVVLTKEELVEIRASQRTFEGAYMRTALSQFSFALIVLKIFSSEFYAIGALFSVYGAAIMLVAIYRRYEGNRQFFSTAEETVLQQQRQSGVVHHDTDNTACSHVVTKKFRTSGNSVALLTVLSLSAYIVLLVLVHRLQD